MGWNLESDPELELEWKSGFEFRSDPMFWVEVKSQVGVMGTWGRVLGSEFESRIEVRVKNWVWIKADDIIFFQIIPKCS